MKTLKKSALAISIVAISVASGSVFANQDVPTKSPTPKAKPAHKKGFQVNKYIANQTYKQIDDSHDIHSSVEIDKKISLSKKIDIAGSVDVAGAINLDAAAISLINDEQDVVENRVYNSYTTNTAAIGSDVGADTAGNIGVNSAAGDNNVQANAVALARVDSTNSWGLSDAETFLDQSAFWNTTYNDYTDNNASISGAFSYASGNIGVNVAAGANNMQKNDLAIAISVAELSEGTARMRQDSWANQTYNTYVTNTASLNNGAFKGATGNIGVNVAAGTGNLQANALNIASSTGH
ncbi:MAG TPA: hypothetical protein ENJ84_09610 [Gammaproteobacteria bacterium]|nr:hypothetical protein [Gammaproteobacteria bacterium]